MDEEQALVDRFTLRNFKKFHSIKDHQYIFFYKQPFFSTQPQCCLIISTILLRHILYLVYLCPSLGLDLFMSYLFDLFLTFSLIFIIINHITSFKQKYLFFVHFLEDLLLFLDDNVDGESQ